jgi:hypothetical protein
MFRWKSSFSGLAGLAVRESRVLLCIPDHKLNLVAQSVVPDDLFGVLAGIC